MSKNNVRAEIVVNGLVQGVGFRYFVLRQAQNLGVKGYVRNLYTGEVFTVAVGDRSLVEELIKQLKIGPSHAHVKNCRVEWSESIEEFNSFEVRF
jgi:acylphosphatase